MITNKLFAFYINVTQRELQNITIFQEHECDGGDNSPSGLCPQRSFQCNNIWLHTLSGLSPVFTFPAFLFLVVPYLFYKTVTTKCTMMINNMIVDSTVICFYF
ncbi:Protein of unknown function [Gryllus bimaculatus]|nr:Protein of unknown function [Gryllus bimaculatus]